MSSSALGNYIVDQVPNKFGGNQAEYLRRSEAAIQSGVTQIKDGVQGGKDLKELFFKLLDQFATERHAIAKDHATQTSWQFGRKRMDVVASFHFKVLNQLYEEFNPKMLLLFQRVLTGKIPLGGEPTQKKFELEDSALGRRCFFEIELVSEKDAADREMYHEVPMKLTLKYLGRDELKRKEPKIDYRNFPPTVEEQRLLQTYNENYKKLKVNCFDFYRHDIIIELVRDMDFTYPKNDKGITKRNYSPANQRNLLVFGKLRIEIQGKKYALSEYMTWAHLDGKTDPVDRMKNAHVTILHQDRFLIDDTLQEIASVFEKAVHCDSAIEKVSELKDQVALIRYLFAHAKPFSKGSAAIGEWLEKTIYQYHGYAIEHNSKTMGDLEALTNLWSTFRKERYDATITLTSERK